MRDRSEIKKFMADQEERHTGKRPEYTDLIRISDAAMYCQMLESKPLNIARVVLPTDKEGTLCSCSFSESEIDVVESDVVCRTCNKKYVA